MQMSSFYYKFLTEKNITNYAIFVVVVLIVFKNYVEKFFKTLIRRNISFIRTSDLFSFCNSINLNYSRT